MDQKTKYRIEDAIQKAVDIKENLAPGDKDRLKIDIVVATIRANSDIAELISSGNYDGILDRMERLHIEVSFIKAQLKMPIFPKGGFSSPSKREGEFVILKPKK